MISTREDVKGWNDAPGRSLVILLGNLEILNMAEESGSVILKLFSLMVLHPQTQTVKILEPAFLNITLFFQPSKMGKIGAIFLSCQTYIREDIG